MYIIRTRCLGIHDLVFALRGRKTPYSSLEVFDKAGLVKDLKPEQERLFVEMLVETHPAYVKNFEHFLNEPPDGILPTDILKAFRERSRLIPTLCVVHFQKDKPISVEKIRDYYQLLSLLSDAREDGLVESEAKKC